MKHISQKIISLGNLRNGQYFRPIYDCEISPILCYERLYSKDHVVTVRESGSAAIFKLPAVLPVRRVIYSE